MRHFPTIILAALATGSAHAFTFFDGDFVPGDWSQANVGPGGSGTVTTQNSGNPGDAAVFDLQSVNGINIWMNYWRPTFSHDPSVNGALTTIQFKQDTIGPRPSTITQPGITAFLIIQNGISYTSTFHSNFSNTTSPEWFTIAEVLTASSFVSTTNINPDFSSSGGLMMFGVQRRTQGGPPSGSTSRLDNFSITAQPVPEPATVTALLAAGLLLRRRRK